MPSKRQGELLGSPCKNQGKKQSTEGGEWEAGEVGGITLIYRGGN